MRKGFQTNEHLRCRVENNVVIDHNGCWIWQKHLDRDGYGVISIRHKPYAAHRISYCAFIGDIPAGLQLDHLCRNRACVNPDHLEPVTTQENTRRGVAARDCCRNGHPITQENSYIAPNGYRVCKICRRITQTKWRAEHFQRAA